MIAGTDPGLSVRLGATSARADGTRTYRLLGNLLLALQLVGFPLVASLAELVGFQSGELSNTFRALVIALSGTMLIWSLSRGRYRIDFLIALFFSLYSIRLLYDFGYTIFPDIDIALPFFMAVVLIPTLALGGVRDWYDEATFLRLSLVIGVLGGLLVALVLATTVTIVILPQDYVDRAKLEFLNPISIGYHGLFVAMAGVILLAKHPQKLWLLPSIAGIALGGYLLVVSGSRGPFVALLLGLVLTGAANRRANAAYVVAGLVVAGVVAYVGLPEGVVTRFRDIGDTSTLQRVEAIQFSFDAMIDNPIFGYAYIEPITGIYPHNLLVEAGLALGLIGAALMGWMQLSLLTNAWRHAQQGEWAAPFLAAAMFANAWISGAIWGSALFFMLLWTLRETPVLRQVDHGRPVPAKLVRR